MTDGELLTTLRSPPGPSSALVEALLERRLYKRAYGVPVVPRSERARWNRRLAHPEERRALEDEIASALGGRPGTALVDLAGLVARGDPAEDWATVGLRNGDRVTYPFREPGPWRAFAVRPTLDWQLAVYVAPRLRRAGVERTITRMIDRL